MHCPPLQTDRTFKHSRNPPERRPVSRGDKPAITAASDSLFTYPRRSCDITGTRRGVRGFRRGLLQLRPLSSSLAYGSARVRDDPIPVVPRCGHRRPRRAQAGAKPHDRAALPACRITRQPSPSCAPRAARFHPLRRHGGRLHRQCVRKRAALGMQGGRMAERSDVNSCSIDRSPIRATATAI